MFLLVQNTPRNPSPPAIFLLLMCDYQVAMLKLEIDRANDMYELPLMVSLSEQIIGLNRKALRLQKKTPLMSSVNRHRSIQPTTSVSPRPSRLRAFIRSDHVLNSSIKVEPLTCHANRLRRAEC